MTTQQAYNEFNEKLKKIYDERESDNITDWVFENITGLKKAERRIHYNTELAENHFKLLQKYLKDLLKHKPVQYVLHEAYFFRMKFYVNKNVLIPRPETEELVEWIVSDVRCLGNIQVIDIGTGSGCIPVSLKKELPNANISAIDVSEKALLVAKKNAKELNTKVNFFQLDFLNENNWNQLQDYDVIVSNPPYIPIKEKEILAKNVTDFEPQIALFVNDNAPFIFYEKIALFAKSHLKKNGKIYVEVHHEYAKNIKAIFENEGFVSSIKKDIYGNERMVKAIKNPG